MKKINISMLVLMLISISSPFINIYAEEITNKVIEEETIEQLGESNISEISTEEIVIQQPKEEVIELQEMTPVEEKDVSSSEQPSLAVVDYTTTAKSVDTTTYTVQNEDKDNKTNLSVAQDSEKEAAGAGESVLQLKGSKSSEVQEYNILSNGEITNSGTKSNDIVNQISVLNGKIVSTDKGIVQTLGGYNQTVYAYHTLEEAQNNLNGISLSGGGFDAEYLSSEVYNGQYYLHLLISGMEGYISIDDAQIIPSSLIQSQSHYENVNGVWTYFAAVDPLTSNTYETYPVSQAPEWAQENVDYYSYDSENYSEDNIEVSKTSTKSSYSYFQNLPFTSSADYTAAQYKSFLSYKGKSNSKYYNSTSAFIDAQNLENINSLVLFAMANHEGAYGTSNLSNKCNNFFGWGAYDSDPSNACKEYGYDTPRDGILSQAIHLTQIWGDIMDWRFAGTEVGNKSHGINVYYASDPDWGVKIASQMYEIDSYLGGKENNKYRIYEIKNSEPTYVNYSTTLKVKDASTTYEIPIKKGNPRVIVTKEQSDAFEYQLPTPKNVSSSTTCKSTNASKGSYPNYEGKYSTTVPKGVASFACDYESFSLQKEWYPKKDAGGNITYNVIANNSITSPGDKTNNTCTISGNYKTCTEKTVNSSGHTKQIIVRRSNVKTGYIVDYNNQTYNSSGKRTYYRHMEYEDDGSIKYDNKTTYNGNGIKEQKVIKEYSSKGKETKYLNEIYNHDGKRTYYRHIMHESDGSIKYDNKTTYTSNGIKKQKVIKEYSSAGKETKYLNEIYNHDGKRTYYRHIMHESDGSIKYDNKTTYTSNGIKKQKVIKEYSSAGKEIEYLNEIYNYDGKRTYYRHIMYESDGSIKYDNKTIYDSNGERQKIVKKYYDSNGKLIKTEEI